MEWTFNDLRKLAKAIGIEFDKATLVAPPNPEPYRNDCVSFNLVGKLGGLRATLFDSNLNDGKRGPTYLQLSLGGFDATETLSSDDLKGMTAAAKKLVSRTDVKIVIAGGGLDKIREKLWTTLHKVITKAGGSESTEWPRQSGELPGYGQYNGKYHSGTIEHIELLRNKVVFKQLQIDLFGDFGAAANNIIKLLKEKKEEPKKKKKNTPLPERLNDLKVTPVVEDGKVTALEDENGEHLRQAELEELGLDPDNLGTVEPHPEGADRGGYLPDVGGAQFSEVANEWQ